ncbi:YbfB/YjiJ family MFS transporter [Microbacterium oryzae]|uniref:YbfB/YjiJ family MFS transporter n=1 Tax=Microbacterium oryzae TaxID=743009 RepID=UPI0025B1C819|nr:YbfB/YjiJ family MFS transporter [Microbacterium oryzae]MDN3310799.1 YbfB/YjiJ family MFS transporter [Microbacterium oryzae]
MTDTSALSHRGTIRMAAAGLALIAVCYGLARFAYGLFVPSFRAAFDLDAGTVGLIASGSYVAYCAGVTLATVATPRLGSRLTAVSAGVAATLGTALIALAPDASLLAVGVLIAGSSTGIASPPLAHAVAHRVASPARDRVQSIVNAGTGLGVVVSGPVALVVADQWRMAWLAFSAAAAAVTAWVAFVIPAARDSSARVSRSPSPLPPGAPRLGAAAALMGVGSAAMWTFGQDLVSAHAGRGAATIAWIVLGACGLLGAAAGDLVDRWGMDVAWSALMVVMAASTAALALAPEAAGIALVASGVFGAVYIAATGVLLVWSTQVFREAPARGVGLAFLLLAVGQAAAAPGWGALADLTGLRTAFWGAAVLSALAVPLRPRARRP